MVMMTVKLSMYRLQLAVRSASVIPFLWRPWVFQVLWNVAWHSETFQWA